MTATQTAAKPRIDAEQTFANNLVTQSKAVMDRAYARFSVSGTDADYDEFGVAAMQFIEDKARQAQVRKKLEAIL